MAAEGGGANAADLAARQLDVVDADVLEGVVAQLVDGAVVHVEQVDYLALAVLLQRRRQHGQVHCTALRVECQFVFEFGRVHLFGYG